MTLLSARRARSFCAFCKSPRRTYARKHVGVTNVLGSLLLAGGLTQLFWGTADPRGLVIFSTLIVFAEVFVYLRWRAALACRLCGFDPIVYKRSPAAASLRVQEFYREAAHDPRFWMSKSPLVEVHRRQRELKRKQVAREAMLERRRVRSAGSMNRAVVDQKSNENTRHHSDLQRA